MKTNDDLELSDGLEVESFDFSNKSDDYDRELDEIEDLGVSKTTENAENSEKKEKTFHFLDVVFVIIVVAVAYFLVSYSLGGVCRTLVGKASDKISSKNDTNYHLSTNGQNIGDFVATKNGFAVCTDQSLNYYKTADSAEYVYPISMGSPRLFSRGDYQILYDVGNKSYSIYKSSKLVFGKKSDDTIVSASIARNGNYIILSSSNDLTDKLTMFDENGLKKFEYTVNNGYMLSASFSDNSKNFACVVGFTENASTKNTVLMFNIKQDKPIYQFSFTDESILAIKYLSNKKLMIITDKNIYSNENEQLFVVYPGDKKTIKCISTENDSLIAAVYVDANDDSSSYLAMFSRSGKEISTINLTGRVVDVSSSLNRVTVLFDKRVDSYSKDGVLVGSTDLQKLADDCILYSNFNFVRTADSIKKYSAYSLNNLNEDVSLDSPE